MDIDAISERYYQNCFCLFEISLITMRNKWKQYLNFYKSTNKRKLIRLRHYIYNSHMKQIYRKLFPNSKMTLIVLALFACVSISMSVTHVQERDDQQLSINCFSVLEFVHITNTGGSFIEQIAATAGIVWGKFHFLNKENSSCHLSDWKHINVITLTKCSKLHNNSTEKWHIPGIYLSPNPYIGHKTFTVVRNPYTRLISEYYHKLSGYKGRYMNNKTSLDTWIQNKILHNSCEDVHLFLQHTYVFNRGEKVVNYVLRFENLVLEFNTVMKEYNIPIRLTTHIKDGNNEYQSLNDLTSKTKKLIEIYARKDFELFNYTYDVCGNLDLTRAIAKALFPERIESIKSNIMFVSGTCNKILNKVILYIDGTDGKVQIPHLQGMYYMGPLHYQQSTLIHTLPYIHVAGTMLLNPSYTANDFLHRRILPAGQRHFMVYVGSDCLNFQEKVFNDIVYFAKGRNMSLPVAIRKCHRSRYKLSEPGNEWNVKVDTITEQMSAFRFVLVTETSNRKGYITERIANAFIANTIPIYYGTTDVFKIFNKQAFIYLDILNPTSALKHIEYLESNHTAYFEVLSQPILANGNKTLQDYFSITGDVGGGKLKHLIRRALIGQYESHALQLKHSEYFIPREIYMLWDSGWENAPKWQKTCLRSWQYLNPTHNVHALDLKSAEKIVDRELMINNSIWSRIKIQAKSDIIRVFILSARGGFWVDASVACNKPLDDWIDYKISFITFRRDDKGSKKRAGPKHQIISPWITSWFMGGQENSYVFRKLRYSVLQFWSTPTFPYEYFWLHRLFANLVANDKLFASAVNVSNLPSGDGPHCLIGNLEQQAMFKRCNQLYVNNKEEKYINT